MSKLLELAAEIVKNEQTGKRRILTHIYRDETLEIQFVLDANEAEQWGAKLMYLATECRKPKPNPETAHFRLGNKLRLLKQMLFRKNIQK